MRQYIFAKVGDWFSIFCVAEKSKKSFCCNDSWKGVTNYFKQVIPKRAVVAAHDPAQKIVVPFLKVKSVNPQYIKNIAFSAAPAAREEELPFDSGLDNVDNDDLRLSSSVIDGIFNRR